MNKIFFSSALLSLFIANISPVMAESKLMIEKSLEQKVNYSHKSETFLIAGFFDSIKDAVDDVTDIVEDIDQTEHRMKERDQELQERQAREEERKRAQAEYEAARKAATEKQVQEAERRRQYWESLSPEEKQVYIDRQQKLRQQQQEAQLFMLGLAAELLLGGGGSSSNQTEGSECGANISQSDCNWHKQQQIENQRMREAGIGY